MFQPVKLAIAKRLDEHSTQPEARLTPFLLVIRPMLFRCHWLPLNGIKASVAASKVTKPLGAGSLTSDVGRFSFEGHIAL